MWCEEGKKKLLAAFSSVSYFSHCGLNVLSSWQVRKQNKRHIKRDPLPRWAESTPLTDEEEKKYPRSFKEEEGGESDDSSVSLAVTRCEHFVENKGQRMSLAVLSGVYFTFPSPDALHTHTLIPADTRHTNEGHGSRQIQPGPNDGRHNWYLPPLL